MPDFIPGQRWISDAELHMGLGTVLMTEHRTVTVVFLATGETRTYAKQSAPLTRVAFAPGDTVRDHEGRAITVEQVEEQAGLLTYVGHAENAPAGHTESLSIPENQLDNFIQLNRPAERLFTAQIDAARWFELRQSTWQHLNRLAHSPLRGLNGARTSLIPHQLYIAHEVARRHAPRVLLADEVGLGKTIEAGLILHHQLLTERARRILIIVPDSLLHQWLVEMLRRFNLAFSLFDEARCEAIAQSTGQDNPFQAEQLILCPLSFFTTQPTRLQQALACDWDMLVVDEAHHLQWSPAGASEEYRVVEQLAARTAGVLLLTATPEQLGKAGHFARLRLLDPHRFHDLDTFCQEEASYAPIADAVDTLLVGHAANDAHWQALEALLDEDAAQAWRARLNAAHHNGGDWVSARDAFIDELLDRHGTGRILFRNTRAAIKGFPERSLRACPLPQPEQYAESLRHMRLPAPGDNATAESDVHYLLCPERLYQTQSGATAHWTQFDPRIDWLTTTLRQLRPEKVLLITASAETVMELAEVLRVRHGIHAALFHEGMSLIERDRAAAYFADREYGSQLLICSEIGSEGRNFQFAHHLVLFDLPLNPDLLEQRIGRLDRIGQTETIHLHVPYLEASPQAALFHWYRTGLDAFEQTCPAGHSVYTEVRETLMSALYEACTPTVSLDTGTQSIDTRLRTLIDTTRQRRLALTAALQQGRDRLLEYNSCRPAVADALTSQAQKSDDTAPLLTYLEKVFDCFGIESEEHSPGCSIVRPGPHMHTQHFPALAEDGMTVTAERDIALANEDMHFLSWEHPLVSGAMDMVVGSEQGNTAAISLRHPAFKAGQLLLEAWYCLEATAGHGLDALRFLPPTTVRVLVDQQGREISAHLSEAQIAHFATEVESATAAKVVRAYQQALRDMLACTDTPIQTHSAGVVQAARQRADTALRAEIERLCALQRVNPNVRDTEIRYLQQQRVAMDEVLAATRPRLDAVRIIVTL